MRLYTFRTLDYVIDAAHGLKGFSTEKIHSTKILLQAIISSFCIRLPVLLKILTKCAIFYQNTEKAKPSHLQKKHISANMEN